MPLIVVVGFVDGKLSHEHIYWHQVSVLVQVGMLDPTNLPVNGIASAKRMDEIRLRLTRYE